MREIQGERESAGVFLRRRKILVKKKNQESYIKDLPRVGPRILFLHNVISLAFLLIVINFSSLSSQYPTHFLTNLLW